MEDCEQSHPSLISSLKTKTKNQNPKQTKALSQLDNLLTVLCYVGLETGLALPRG